MLANKLYEYNKQKLINRYQYLGILGTYQTISKDLYQPIVYNNLNQRQHFLFKRVLHGLNVYTPEEIKSMHSLNVRELRKFGDVLKGLLMDGSRSYVIGELMKYLKNTFLTVFLVKLS